MKKITTRFVQGSAIASVVFGLAFTALAGTWAAPTLPPPNGNVDAPVNVGTTTQVKAGSLGIGETTAPSYLGGTGSILDVNGTTSTNGLANFGLSSLVQHVTIGTAPCPSCVITGGSTGGTTGEQPEVRLAERYPLAGLSHP